MAVKWYKKIDDLKKLNRTDILYMIRSRKRKAWLKTYHKPIVIAKNNVSSKSADSLNRIYPVKNRQTQHGTLVNDKH